MGISTSEYLAKIHQEALAEFNEIQGVMREQRLQCLQDRRFYSIAGAQWEGALSDQFENRPKFEFNKVHLAVIRVFNEYRNNRITVDFVPKDGTKNDKLADACDDMYRADEQDSVADEAYDNAFEEAVGGGFGAWRLRTEYEDEYDDEDTRQCIKFEPITDADSTVFFDLNAKRQDKSDAKRCFVLCGYSPAAYIEEYGDDPATWPKAISLTEFDWSTPDNVWVAEYYREELKKEVVQIWKLLSGKEKKYKKEDFDNDETLLEMLEATGAKLIKEKRVKRKRVHKFVLSGGGILEDEGYIAGDVIPVIPVYGKRWFVDGIERCMGHIRLAKDAQRLVNMLRSWLAEISAFSPIEKPMFTPEQMAGHAQMWADDPTTNYPYLLINPVADPATGQKIMSGPLGYTKPPAIPPAIAALLQTCDIDLKELLGAQDQGDQMLSNVSGRAVELVQQRLDMQPFIYMSNFAKAMQRCGEIWLKMKTAITVEEGRKVKGINATGEVRSIEILRPIVNPETHENEYENDLSKAKFGVVAQVGPSSTSKRSATVRALTSMMAITTDPQDAAVIGAMAMMNMEGEGIDEARQYFRRKLLNMGAVKPTEEEAAEMAAAAQNAGPDPQTAYLLSAAEEAQAKAAKARADTVATITKAELTRAQTVETMAKVDAAEQQQALEIIDRFPQRQEAQPPAPGE